VHAPADPRQDPQGELNTYKNIGVRCADFVQKSRLLPGRLQHGVRWPPPVCATACRVRLLTRNGPIGPLEGMTGPECDRADNGFIAPDARLRQTTFGKPG
jgi:hypothetical protein